MPAEARRRWTAPEVAELQLEDRAYPRFELVDGELLVTPSPQFPHQSVITELSFLILGYLRGNDQVRAWLSPADIRLAPETIVQPDIFVAPRVDMNDEGWLAIRSLILAVEVLSPGSMRPDRTTKRQFYQRRNVSEYWIVDTDNQRIERWRPDDREPAICADRLEWHAPGAGAPLTVDIPELFREAIRP